MEQRIKHSENVGSVLTSTLKIIHAEKASKLEASQKAVSSAPKHVANFDPNKLPIRVAMKRRKLLRRGSGVYEDEKNGDLWFREGEYLIKQDIDLHGIVENYLNQCKGT